MTRAQASSLLQRAKVHRAIAWWFGHTWRHMNSLFREILCPLSPTFCSQRNLDLGSALIRADQVLSFLHRVSEPAKTAPLMLALGQHLNVYGSWPERLGSCSCQSRRLLALADHTGWPRLAPSSAPGLEQPCSPSAPGAGTQKPRQSPLLLPGLFCSFPPFLPFFFSHLQSLSPSFPGRSGL